MPPANQAPTAEPSSAEATAVPRRKLPGSNCSRMAPVVPLMTELSNPKSSPPSAAASASPVTPRVPASEAAERTATSRRRARHHATSARIEPRQGWSSGAADVHRPLRTAVAGDRCCPDTGRQRIRHGDVIEARATGSLLVTACPKGPPSGRPVRLSGPAPSSVRPRHPRSATSAGSESGWCSAAPRSSSPESHSGARVRWCGDRCP